MIYFEIPLYKLMKENMLNKPLFLALIAILITTNYIQPTPDAPLSTIAEFYSCLDKCHNSKMPNDDRKEEYRRCLDKYANQAALEGHSGR